MISFSNFLMLEADANHGALTQALHDIQGGIRKFVRLKALRDNQAEAKWVRDEQDLIDAVNIVREKFHETERFTGQQMHKDMQYDVTEDVKEEIEEILLGGRDPKEAALNRRRNLNMYHLVIEPMIDSLKGMSHEEAIRYVDKIADNVINMIENVDISSHYDDALVAKEQVSQLVKQRDAQRKEVKTARKRRMLPDMEME